MVALPALQIGIDVEEKQRRPNGNVLALANRYFSPPEVQYLNSLVDSDSQKIEFIKLWTLKVRLLLVDFSS